MTRVGERVKPENVCVEIDFNKKGIQAISIHVCFTISFIGNF